MRVPELMTEEIAQKSGYKLDQAAPIATVQELADCRSGARAARLSKAERLDADEVDDWMKVKSVAETPNAMGGRSWRVCRRRVSRSSC